MVDLRVCGVHEVTMLHWPIMQRIFRGPMSIAAAAQLRFAVLEHRDLLQQPVEKVPESRMLFAEA